MLRLAAGRPMLILGGELDPNGPIEGAQIAIKEGKEAYRKGGAGDQFKVMIAPGAKHQVTAEQRQAALDWFEKWLK
jgi:hypothetical protein